MAERTPKAPQALEIAEIQTTTQQFAILGRTPIILNRLSEKTKQELLAPAGRKSLSQRQASLKHDPFAEFRAAPQTLKDPQAPSYLSVPSSMFKAAMCTAALDLPGAHKAQIGRLVWVEGIYVPLYGMPYLEMSPVRSADINHTPDIRTRVTLKQWACSIQVTYVASLIKAQAIVNLLSAAGLTAGIGDWRPQKGKGTYGQFRVVNPSDPAFQACLETGGRAVQQAAMENPTCADEETEALLEWWMATAKERGFALGDVQGDDEDEAAAD